MSFLKGKKGKKSKAPPGTFVIKNKNANRLYNTIRENVYGYTQSNEQHLDDGSILDAVLLPKHEESVEWIAANTVDFYNELKILYDLCQEHVRQEKYKPGEGFPLNHQYQWATATGPIEGLNGAEYCEHVLAWVEEVLDDRSVFPVEDDEPWPEDFVSRHMTTVYRRMFRVFNIIYHKHYKFLLEEDKKTEDKKAEFHLNTCFKHFIFFCKEFSLLDFNSVEVNSLSSAISNIVRKYERACEKKEKQKTQAAEGGIEMKAPQEVETK